MVRTVIDLHTHSTCSDGSVDPAAVCDLAAAAGLRAFALTDHDTLAGVAEARRRGAETGVAVVAGCEVSCAFAGGAAHVLCYFVEDAEGPLAAELGRLRADRVVRNRRTVERLGELGIPLAYDEVVAEAAGEESVGRPHIAAVLVRRGAAASLPDAFDRWLAEGRPAHVPKARVTPAEIARAAAAEGAVVALAHPLSLGLAPDALDAAVADLAACGFAGLESTYGRYRPHEREALAALARRHDLVATGGSDFHGAPKPDLAVGTGTGDLRVPDAVLSALEARRPPVRGR